MTRDEAKILVATMKVVYPNYHPVNETFTVNTWASLLEEYEFLQVQTAFKRFVLTDTSGFAPSIGQLVAQMQEVAEDDSVGELEAWSMVSRAVRNSGYHAEEEFDRLPPLVQRVVHSPSNLREWAAMDTDTVNSVIQSHVVRNYRAAAKAAREEARLPQKFRGMVTARKKIPDRLIAREPQPAVEAELDTESAGMTPEREKTVNDLVEGLKRRLAGNGNPKKES